MGTNRRWPYSSTIMTRIDSICSNIEFPTIIRNSYRPQQFSDNDSFSDSFQFSNRPTGRTNLLLNSGWQLQRQQMLANDKYSMPFSFSSSDSSSNALSAESLELNEIEKKRKVSVSTFDSRIVGGGGQHTAMRNNVNIIRAARKHSTITFASIFNSQLVENDTSNNQIINNTVLNRLLPITSLKETRFQ
jgi:hypothetical protein